MSSDYILELQQEALQNEYADDAYQQQMNLEDVVYYDEQLDDKINEYQLGNILVV